MKKIAIFGALALSLTLPASALASTFYDAGASSPQSVMVYGTNQWSQVGTWDLTNDASIPDGATIDIISEAYNICTSSLGCGMNYTDTHVGLFDGVGTGYYVNSGTYISNFSGESAKQAWTTQFWVSNTLVGARGWIQPVLRLYWNSPATGASGVTTLNANGTTTTTSTSTNESIQSAAPVSLSDAKPFTK